MNLRIAIGGAFAALLFSSNAGAQSFRSYLASDGSDANPCTLPQPCRLLPAALAAVADGGEIWMLDSANYNTAGVTIGKSVAILAVPGAVASVLSINYESAIQVTTSGLNVALRNLVIGQLAGSNGWQGVDLVAGSRLTIDNCLIAGVDYNGVRVSGGTVEITNSVIRDTGGNGVILFDGSSVDISGTRILGNFAAGVYVYAYDGSAVARATVSDSVISGGAEGGIYVVSQVAGGDARAFVTRSTIQGSMYALRSRVAFGGQALIGVSNSLIANNNYGWSITGSGAVIKSLGNNHIADSGSGSLTLTAPQ